MSKEPCSPNKAYHGYCVTQVPANRYPSHAGTRLCNTRGYYYRVRHLKVYDGYYPGKQCILPGYPPIIPADPGKPSCQNDGYPLPAGIYPCYALQSAEWENNDANLLGGHGSRSQRGGALHGPKTNLSCLSLPSLPLPLLCTTVPSCHLQQLSLIISLSVCQSSHSKAQYGLRQAKTKG